MSIPPGTFGYGAVVLPHLNEFQGFFLVKNDELNKQAVRMQLMAMAVTPQGVHGALQAAVVEGVVTKDWQTVGAAALALWGVSKQPFFWIEASKETTGTRTELFPLKAQSIQAAQIEINNLPLVLEIKCRLVKDMKRRKQ